MSNSSLNPEQFLKMERKESAKRLLEVMKNKRLNQKGLAEKLSVSQPTISRWLKEGVPPSARLKVYDSLLKDSKVKEISPEKRDLTPDELQQIKKDVKDTYGILAEAGQYPHDFALTIWKEFQERIIKRLGGLLDSMGEFRVADLGTGPGTAIISLCESLGERARKFTMVGVDFSPQMLEKAKQNSESKGFNIDFIEDDIEVLKKLEDKQFDLVISNLFLPQDYDKALENAIRISKGFLAISFVGKDSFKEFFEAVEVVFRRNEVLSKKIDSFMKYKFMFDARELWEILDRKELDILEMIRWTFSTSPTSGKEYFRFVSSLLPLENVLFKRPLFTPEVEEEIWRELDAHLKESNRVECEIIYVLGRRRML
jgi:ubiquinone/menaquinone biosynthesis C-methylase UbiE/predicted transcriptional regulator